MKEFVFCFEEETTQPRFTYLLKFPASTKTRLRLTR